MSIQRFWNEKKYSADINLFLNLVNIRLIGSENEKLDFLKVITHGGVTRSENKMLELQLVQDLKFIKLRNAILLDQLKTNIEGLNTRYEHNSDKISRWKNSFQII